MFSDFLQNDKTKNKIESTQHLSVIILILKYLQSDHFLIRVVILTGRECGTEVDLNKMKEEMTSDIVVCFLAAEKCSLLDAYETV